MSTVRRIQREKREGGVEHPGSAHGDERETPVGPQGDTADDERGDREADVGAEAVDAEALALVLLGRHRVQQRVIRRVKRRLSDTGDDRTGDEPQVGGRQSGESNPGGGESDPGDEDELRAEAIDEFANRQL